MTKQDNYLKIVSSLIVVLFSSWTATYSQNVEWSWSDKMKQGEIWEATRIVKSNESGTIVLLQLNPVVGAKYYFVQTDEDLIETNRKLFYTKKKEGKKQRFLGVYEKDDIIFFFTRDYKGTDPTSVYCTQFDAHSLEVLNEAERVVKFKAIKGLGKKFAMEYRLVYSPDSSFFSVVQYAYKKSQAVSFLSAASFDEDINLLWRSENKIDSPSIQFRPSEYAMDIEGNLFLSGSILKPRTIKRIDYFDVFGQKIVKLSKVDGSLSQVDLVRDGKLLGPGKFLFVNREQLVIVGFYAKLIDWVDYDIIPMQGCYTFTFPSSNLEESEWNFKQFAAGIENGLSTIGSKEDLLLRLKSELYYFNSEYFVFGAIKQNDEIVVIGERITRYVEVSSGVETGVGSDFGDVLIARVETDKNTVSYETIDAVKHFAELYGIVVSRKGILTNDGRTYLLFYDDHRNLSPSKTGTSGSAYILKHRVVVQVVISENGVSAKKPVDDYNDDNFMVEPDKCFLDESGNYIFIAEHKANSKAKFKLGQVSFR